MMLSRLACILISVYALQVAAGSAGGRRSARETAATTARCAGASPGACPRELGGCGCRAGAATAVTIIGVRIETVRGVGYRIVTS